MQTRCDTEEKWIQIRTWITSPPTRPRAVRDAAKVSEQEAETFTAYEAAYMGKG